MFAQINHMAMVSPHYPLLGKFYDAVFGLRISGKPRPDASVSIGDGYVGLNILPQRDGYFGGLDHFGMVVDDAQAVLERMQRKFPKTSIVKRPATRPFAAYSGHDPDGNVFDLAQKKNDTRIDILRRASGGRMVTGPLPQQIRYSDSEREFLCRVLSRRFRIGTGGEQIQCARSLFDRWTRHARDLALENFNV